MTPPAVVLHQRPSVCPNRFEAEVVSRLDPQLGHDLLHRVERRRAVRREHLLQEDLGDPVALPLDHPEDQIPLRVPDGNHGGEKHLSVPVPVASVEQLQPVQILLDDLQAVGTAFDESPGRSTLNIRVPHQATAAPDPHG